MDFYQELIKLSEEERDSYLEKRLQSFQEMNQDNNRIVGYHVGEQRSYCLDEDENICMNVRCFHDGFIPENTKIVYGAFFTPDGKVTNKGNYYYMNDSSYIIDFCHFLMDHPIDDEYDLFDAIHIFLRQYFGMIKECDREDMFRLILDEKGEYLTPGQEHSIDWFQGRGNAMCSEFAVMAQNILAFFGFESYVLIGQEQTGNGKDESHAFNIVSFYEDEDSPRTDLLLDFSSFVNVYDIDFHKIGEAPFIGFLYDLDEELFHKILFEEEHLIFEDYNYYFLGDRMCQIAFDRNRDYYIGNSIQADHVSTKKKKK